MKPIQALARYLALALLLLPAAAEGAARERLALRHTQIELPGAPAAIVPADVDGDGVRDLAVVIAYTEWDQLALEEHTEMDDVRGLVEVLTIVPALLDRRELVLYLGTPDGGYRAAGPPLALARSVLSLEAGPPGYPVVALTDDGLAALRLDGDGIRLEPVGLELHYPLPEVRDVDGDGRPDLVLFPGGFQDLDGDGRLDLVTVTLDFSVLQAVRVLATHSISIGLDFHLWCQRDDGALVPVRGLDLSGKFRLDLDNLRVGQLSQFAGDFDGDGRADFVQMGRGKRVTIHRGQVASTPRSPTW